jgi:hypothetical protein
MKIFQPQHDDAEDGYATSFTFDDKEEQQSFSDFLNSMGIPYLKSKFPVIEDGKVRYQIGFVVQQSAPSEQVGDESVAAAEPEPESEHQVVEEPKSSKKKVKSVTNHL